MSPADPPTRLRELVDHLEHYLLHLRERGVRHIPSSGRKLLSTPTPDKAPPLAPADASRAEAPAVTMQPARRRPGLDENKHPLTLLVAADTEDFAGEAGHLLDNMLAAIDFLRVGEPEPWRETGPEETQAAALLALGDAALQRLSGQQTWSVRTFGSRWQQRKGLPMMPSYPPRLLLQSAGYKKQAWKDLQAVCQRLGCPLPERRS